MSRGAAAHIDDFHIVVGVLRKMDETGVWTDADELTMLQHLFAVHDKLRSGRVNLLLNGGVAIQKLLFFFCDGAKLTQQIFPHGMLLSQTDRLTINRYTISIAQKPPKCK